MGKGTNKTKRIINAHKDPMPLTAKAKKTLEIIYLCSESF